MGDDQVSRAEVRPVLVYVRLVGVLVTRNHNDNIITLKLLLTTNIYTRSNSSKK